MGALGLFSILGTADAIGGHIPPFIAALFGVITGVFGGVLRDVVLAEIPVIFRQSTLYATCAFLGSCLYLGALFLRLNPSVAGAIGFTAIVISRMLALRYKVTLPFLYTKDALDRSGDRL